jgi:hypothetical protein
VFWVDYSRVVAEYQATIWLGLVYFLVIGPVSLVMRALGKALLPTTFGRVGSHWVARAPVPRDLNSMRRPY